MRHSNPKARNDRGFYIHIAQSQHSSKEDSSTPIPQHLEIALAEYVPHSPFSLLMPHCRGLTPVGNSAPRSRFPLPPPSGMRRRKGKKKVKLVG